MVDSASLVMMSPFNCPKGLCKSEAPVVGSSVSESSDLDSIPIISESELFAIASTDIIKLRDEDRVR